MASHIANPLNSIAAAIPLALFVTLLTAWFSIRIAYRAGLIDHPGSQPHKRHARPTPLAGGIALLAALLMSEGLLGNISHPLITAAFVACLPIFLVGLWDDYKSASPLLKIAAQSLAAAILISLDIYVKIFESPEFFTAGAFRLQIASPVDVYLDWLITIFWIVGITNALNFVDSMDGLAVGLSGVAAAFFILVTLQSQQTALVLHSAVLLGACIVLYFYNSSPAMLFLGDSGAQLLGFFLAVLGITYQPQGANQSSSWLVPILLLGVPIFDTVLIVFSRLRHHRPVYRASLDHTYHRLLNLGLGSQRAVQIMHMAALILNCIAFFILSQPPLVANLIFFATLIAAAILLILAEIALDRKPLP